MVLPFPGTRPAIGAVRAVAHGCVAAGLLAFFGAPGVTGGPGGIAHAAAPGIIDALSPAQGISSTNFQVTVPVTLRRGDSAGIRLYHVEFTITNLVLPHGAASLAEGDFLRSLPGARTALLVTDEGGGLYAVDGVILGHPCGQVATAGTLFSLVLEGAAGDGTGSVQIGDIQLRDCDNDSLMALPGATALVTIDRTPPAVSVNSPSGGETWVVDSPQDIRWTATDVSGVTSVDIALSVDGGATFPYPVATGVANSESYAWITPNTPSGRAKIRVTARDALSNVAVATSDSGFAIGFHVLSASAGPGGSIAPAGNTPVRHGASLGYAIAPDSGFHVRDVRVDATSVGAVSAYTFMAVMASHVIEATFESDAYVKTILAYPTPASVAPGDSIAFHVSSDFSLLDVRFYRYGARLTEVLRVNSVQGHHYDTPDSSYATGCRWPVALALAVPASWVSGVYLAYFSSPATGASTNAIFVVRPAAPGYFSKTLYVVPYATYEAYNGFGGKSLYDGPLPASARSPRVSLERPFGYNNGAGAFEGVEGPFTSWFEKGGFAAEYCSNVDLALNPGMLNNYPLAVIAGHHEYWTKEERDAFEAFRNRGGRIALLNANCAYWQTRLEDAGRTVVCYKSSITDPATLLDPPRTTVRFRDSPVNRPEGALLGVMYGSNAVGYGRSIVMANPTGWIFSGTGLLAGDSVGANIVGGEWDDATPFAPLSTRMLFNTPTNPPGQPPGHSVGTYYETASGWGSGIARGARVFAAGTVQWCLGLDSTAQSLPSWQIQRITRNLLQNLCQFDSSNRATQVIFRLDVRLIPFSPGVQVQIMVRGTSTIPTSTGLMADDGVAPDSAAGDLIFTKSFSFPAGMPKPSGVAYTLLGDQGQFVDGVRQFVIVDSAGSAAVQKLPVERVSYSVDVAGSGDVPRFALAAAGPNPFVRRTAISYSVDRRLAETREPVKIEVCDAGGRVLKVLRDGPAAAGHGQLIWDGRDHAGRQVPAGVYFCRMSGGAQEASFKLLRVR